VTQHLGHSHLHTKRNIQTGKRLLLFVVGVVVAVVVGGGGLRGK